jgi:signal peptidase I
LRKMPPVDTRRGPHHSVAMETQEPKERRAAETYKGETAPRTTGHLTALTLICPGIGSLYVGRLMHGFSVSLCICGLIAIFSALAVFLQFFPVLPGIVAAIALVILVLASWRVNRRTCQSPDAYILRSYNHWTTYSAFALMTYLAPIGLTVQLVNEYGVGIHEIHDLDMYPTFQAGDRVLWYKNHNPGESPKRGDLVVVEQQGIPVILRVVAIASDVVRMDGDVIFVNDEMLDHRPLSDSEKHEELPNAIRLERWWEKNQGRLYPVSTAPQAFSSIEIPSTKLATGEVFLLSDNRSQATIAWKQRIRDSRILGPIRSDEIQGRPRYIAWSQYHNSGQANWERIGIRTE